MTVERVTMKHIGTKAEIHAPATAVKTYERSGWVLVKDEPVTDPPAAGKTRSVKEETK